MQAIFEKFSIDETSDNNEHHRFASNTEICAADGISDVPHAKQGIEWNNYDPAMEKDLDAEETKVNETNDVLVDSIIENPNITSCDMDEEPESDENAVFERCELLAIAESTAVVSATVAVIAIDPEQTSISSAPNTFEGHRKMATDEINTNKNVTVVTDATTSFESPIAEIEIGSFLIAEQQCSTQNLSNTFTVQNDSEILSEADASMKFSPIVEELIGNVHHVVDDSAADFTAVNEIHSIEGLISYVHQLPTITEECTTTFTPIAQDVSANMPISSQTSMEAVSDPLPTIIIERSQRQSPKKILKEHVLALELVTGYYSQSARNSTESTGDLVSVNQSPISLEEFAMTLSANADEAIGDMLQPSESAEQLISNVHQLPAITNDFMAALTPMAEDDSQPTQNSTEPIEKSVSNLYPLQTTVEETTAPFTFVDENHSQNRSEAMEGRDVPDMATILETSEPSSDSASIESESPSFPALFSSLEVAKSQMAAHTSSKVADPEMATKETEIGSIPDDMSKTAVIITGSELQSQVAANTSFDTLSMDADATYACDLHNKFSEYIHPDSTTPIDDEPQSNESDPNTPSMQKEARGEEVASANLVNEITIEKDVTHPKLEPFERMSLGFTAQSVPLANTPLTTETIALDESETSSTTSKHDASVPLNQFSSEVGEEEDYLLPSIIFRNNLGEAGNDSVKKLYKEKRDIDLEIRQMERRLNELRSVHDQITLKYNEEKKRIAKSHKKRPANGQKISKQTSA